VLKWSEESSEAFRETRGSTSPGKISFLNRNRVMFNKRIYKKYVNNFLKSRGKRKSESGAARRTMSRSRPLLSDAYGLEEGFQLQVGMVFL